jgi:4-alpha-glucanotransferase
MALKNRSSGLLLALSSLPNDYGIGDLGPWAFRWIEFLQEHRQRYWQLLPVGIFDEHACPYSSYSAFGGHHLFISLEELHQEGLLQRSDLEEAKIPASEKMNLQLVIEKKTRALKKAAQNFYNSNQNADSFFTEYPFWGKPLIEFLDGKFGGNYQEHLFWQFSFHKQWKKLKTYAERHGVELFGDLPIFVGPQSMDTRKFPENFKLDNEGRLLVVTGAPPDGFSPGGQIWNTPNYDWEKMSERGFDWWVQRMGYQQELFHTVRIDHFIGLVNVWEVSPGALDASGGKWVRSRGRELLIKVLETYPNINLIAEDLGSVTQEVHDLRDEFKLPGMRVYQFSMDGDEKNIHSPKNVNEQCVYYTGTHDNPTLCQWLDESGLLSKGHSTQSALENIFSSQAKVVISPVQDILRLPANARMNIPGTVENNWIWRMQEHQLESSHWDELSELTVKTQRSS